MGTTLRMEPADQGTVRRTNLSLVLRLLRSAGPRSRADVAAETGLTKATVSSLVADLIDRGLVREVGPTTAQGLGRPATLLELDGRRVAALGLEVNVGFVEVLATDLAGRQVFHRTRAVRPTASRGLGTLRVAMDLAEEALTTVAPACPTVAGITVALPGLVDLGARSLTLAPNLHWHDLDVRRQLVDRLGRVVPITVDNDANLSALAEYRMGEFAGVRHLVAIAGQTGVGAGIIVDGRLLRGSRGFAGEVGHIKMADDGPACGCGRTGCLESLVGLRALLTDAVPDQAAALLKDTSKGPEARLAPVVARAEAGDPATLDALQRCGRWLGAALAVLVDVLNPEVIVLGGFYGPIAEWILPPAEQAMRAGSIAPDAGGCRLAASTLGFSTAALGGAIHAAQRVFDDPFLVEPQAG